MREVLRANTAHDGAEHGGVLLEPEHVHLDDHQDVARFSYPDVSYAYDRREQLLAAFRDWKLTYG